MNAGRSGGIVNSLQNVVFYIDGVHRKTQTAKRNLGG